MQPFVSLAVVLILDGTLTNTAPECQLPNITLCTLLNWIYRHNVELEISLGGDTALRDIRDGVLAANVAPFVSLVAFLVLDGALANTAPKCKLPNATLCTLLGRIHKQNEELEISLAGAVSMQDIKEAISAANKAVLEALESQKTISKAIRMASMQLFVPLVVALSLEKILAYEEPKCVHQEKPTLCKLLLPLYKDTAELEVTLVKAALPDLSAAVSDAMQAVLEALSTTEKTKDAARKEVVILKKTAATTLATSIVQAQD
ncbi:hypothetical protein Q1695_004371 [Nippostrongylus brasiliensis]|nr:hypothetical protein Q1695_004371 [Nippostrongylus brasiliensis]